ncbi:hypothetical protein A2U01_0093952, partial [Trifolium medium]|nr:hypothetical protein [Trifolium medium]
RKGENKESSAPQQSRRTSTGNDLQVSEDRSFKSLLVGEKEGTGVMGNIGGMVLDAVGGRKKMRVLNYSDVAPLELCVND